MTVDQFKKSKEVAGRIAAVGEFANQLDEYLKAATKRTVPYGSPANPIDEFMGNVYERLTLRSKQLIAEELEKLDKEFTDI